jgi:hypothetical protein
VKACFMQAETDDGIREIRAPGPSERWKLTGIRLVPESQMMGFRDQSGLEVFVQMPVDYQPNGSWRWGGWREEEALEGNTKCS